MSVCHSFSQRPTLGGKRNHQSICSATVQTAFPARPPCSVSVHQHSEHRVKEPGI